jgi:MarR family transcriptional regulator, organic hydroperoxide resistance regulator
VTLEATPPHTDVHDQLGSSFKAAMAAVRRLRGRETHRPGQLSYAQYSLLFGLAEAGELSSTELARAADLSPATAAQMLDGLEASGLVARTRSQQDKRIVLTSLTERCREVVAERRALLEPRWRQALAEFSDDELRAAGAVLERLTEFFDGMLDEDVAAG